MSRRNRQPNAQVLAERTKQLERLQGEMRKDLRDLDRALNDLKVCVNVIKAYRRAEAKFAAQIAALISLVVTVATTIIVSVFL